MAERIAKIALIIPALNEAATIVSVVMEVNHFGRAIVVDDGSTDGTGDLACNAGAVVVTHVQNRGYDEALASGIRRAIDEGYDFAVTIDGDGQHQPEILSKFIEKLVRGADVVIGERDCHQRFSESLFAYLTKWLWGISDPLCGMKGYRLTLFSDVKLLTTYRSIGTELGLRALRSGFRVDQIPIMTRPRKGLSRFGGGVLANLRILKAMLLGLVLAKPLSAGPKP